MRRFIASLSALMLLLLLPGSSGASPVILGSPLPGPPVLYEPLAAAPQLSGGNDWNAAPLMVSGAQAYVAGEYLYQDYIYDAYGANTTDIPFAPPDTVPSSTDTSFGGATGDVVYPTDIATYAYNAADLLEFRARLTGGEVAYRVTLNTMIEPSAAAVAIGIDSAPGGRDEWGSGIGSLGDLNLEHVIIASGGHATLDGVPVPVTTDAATNQIHIETPLAPAGATWKHFVVAGLWDAAAKSFKQILEQPTATMPGGSHGTNAPPIFNVGFRFNEPTVSASAAGMIASPTGSLGTRSTGAGAWREHAQALALSKRDIGSMSAAIDFGKIDASMTDFTGVPKTGVLSRLFASRLNLGEGARPDRPMLLGKIQPYTVYIPTTYTPGTAVPLTLALHSLSCSYNQFAVYAPNLYRDLGEDRGAIVLTPEARGPDGWYHDEAEYDVFEAWNDLAHRYSIDMDRVSVNGYSMGGYATLRFASTWPDLFTAGLGVVGPADENILGAPSNGQIDDEGTLDLYENLREVPLLLWYGVNDELVPVAGALNVAQRLRNANVVHEVDFFPGMDHFSLSLIDEWDRGRDWLNRAPIDRDPARVRYVTKPALDNGTLDLVHDHAYWLFGITTEPGLASGTVEVTSLGRGFSERVLKGIEPPAGDAPAPHVKSGFVESGSADELNARNELIISAQGITALAIDLERAGIAEGQVTLTVLSEDPITVRLFGYNRSMTKEITTGGTYTVTF